MLVISKYVKLDKYTLTKVFNHKGDVVELEKAMKNNKIYNIDEDEIVFEKPIEYYLPRILQFCPLRLHHVCIDINSHKVY